ncbi:MAG: DUF1540 domain-containing protein [Syntrophomonas sp.]|nr:DUF1540 domain-containing protein [Syntrophomonas sp.]
MNKKQQTIHCDVSSCQYHNTSDFCTLNAIRVTPCQHIHNGAPEDETLCSSYEKLS